MKNFCTGFSSFYIKNEAEFVQTFENLESGIKKVFIENRNHVNFIYRKSSTNSIEEHIGLNTLESSDMRLTNYNSKLNDQKYDISEKYVNPYKKVYINEKSDHNMLDDSAQVPVFNPKTTAGTESSPILKESGLKVCQDELI